MWVYRWQSEFFWESSFGDGIIPAFGTADAQVSYKLPSKMMLKVGGSNLLNNYYIQSFGAPRIGAIYYVSITFESVDELRFERLRIKSLLNDFSAGF